MNKSKRTDRDSLVKKAAYLRLMAIKLAEDMKSGTFKSLYKGQGIEFSGVRDYIRGDDVRSIDWNVTARMNKPFVKVFEEAEKLRWYSKYILPVILFIIFIQGYIAKFF